MQDFNASSLNPYPMFLSISQRLGVRQELNEISTSDRDLNLISLYHQKCWDVGF